MKYCCDVFEDLFGRGYIEYANGFYTYEENLKLLFCNNCGADLRDYTPKAPNASTVINDYCKEQYLNLPTMRRRIDDFCASCKLREKE